MAKDLTTLFANVSFVDGFDEAFEAINNNFIKVASKLLTGQDGESIKFFSLPLYSGNDLNELGTLIYNTLGEYLLPSGYVLTEEKFKEWIPSGYTWKWMGINNTYTEPFDLDTLYTTMYPADELQIIGTYEYNGTQYISLELFINESPNVHFEFREANNKIYYNTSVGNFCWKINGIETTISATGIQGERGNGANIHIIKREKDTNDIYKYFYYNFDKLNNDDSLFNNCTRNNIKEYYLSELPEQYHIENGTLSMIFEIQDDNSIKWYFGTLDTNIDENILKTLDIGDVDIQNVGDGSNYFVWVKSELGNAFNIENLNYETFVNIMAHFSSSNPFFIPSDTLSNRLTQHRLYNDNNELKIGRFYNDDGLQVPNSSIDIKYKTTKVEDMVGQDAQFDTLTTTSLNTTSLEVGTLTVGGKHYLTENITFDALKLKADSSELVAGKSYLITDYECFVKNNYTHDNVIFRHKPTQVTQHIIVTAITNNLLDEDAILITNSKIYNIKYSILGTNYNWYDTGKGVIYEMRDSRCNIFPYDFLNIEYNNPSFEWKSTFENYLTNSNNIVGGCSFDIPTVFFIGDCNNNQIGLNGNKIDLIQSNRNKIGDNCSTIKFETNCNDNIVGDNCSFIYFGVTDGIQFGIPTTFSSIKNKIGNNCSQININYYGNTGENVDRSASNNIFEDGVQELVVGNSVNITYDKSLNNTNRMYFENYSSLIFFTNPTISLTNDTKQRAISRYYTDNTTNAQMIIDFLDCNAVNKGSIINTHTQTFS